MAGIDLKFTMSGIDNGYGLTPTVHTAAGNVLSNTVNVLSGNEGFTVNLPTEPEQGDTILFKNLTQAAVLRNQISLAQAPQEERVFAQTTQASAIGTNLITINDPFTPPQVAANGMITVLGEDYTIQQVVPQGGTRFALLLTSLLLDNIPQGTDVDIAGAPVMFQPVDNEIIITQGSETARIPAVVGQIVYALPQNINGDMPITNIELDNSGAIGFFQGSLTSARGAQGAMIEATLAFTTNAFTNIVDVDDTPNTRLIQPGNQFEFAPNDFANIVNVQRFTGQIRLTLNRGFGQPIPQGVMRNITGNNFADTMITITQNNNQFPINVMPGQAAFDWPDGLDQDEPFTLAFNTTGDVAGTLSVGIPTITIGRNGNNIDAREDDIVTSTRNESFRLVYINDGVGWAVLD